MGIQFDGFGRPLRNPMSIARGRDELVSVSSLA